MSSAALSAPTREAVQVLGLEIARSRRARRWSQAELAERGGVTRVTVRNVERGAPSVAIGTAFELAVLVGVPLFGVDAPQLSALAAGARDRLAVLPARVRSRQTVVDEDF